MHPSLIKKKNKTKQNNAIVEKKKKRRTKATDIQTRKSKGNKTEFKLLEAARRRAQ